jgi:hypothetical protein
LLGAKRSAPGSPDWQAHTAEGSLTLRAFSNIKDENYRLYLKVDG